MGTVSIQDNLRTVQAEIAAAAAAAGRDPATVRLVAVSKTVPPDAIAAAYAAGQRRFGENRVQELRDKIGRLPADCEWHLLGHLQGNKARQAVQSAAWLHSIDSVELLERLDRLAGEEHRRPVILLQVNISGEATKSGVDTTATALLLEAALRCPHLDCRGLMTMAPYEAPEADLRRIFGGLRELRDRLAAQFNTPLPELSMGMSGDFRSAIAAGATLVRIGTAIFGGR